MSSPRFATPLILEPRPSRGLLSLMLLAHGGAVAVLLALDAWPWSLRLLLAALVLVNLWFTLGKLGWWQHPAQIQRLIWQTENQWQLALRNGETLAAELQSSSFLHPWLVVLNLRVDGRRWPHSVLLTRDSLDDAPFRQLRVRLATEASKLFEKR